MITFSKPVQLRELAEVLKKCSLKASKSENLGDHGALNKDRLPINLQLKKSPELGLGRFASPVSTCPICAEC